MNKYQNHRGSDRRDAAEADRRIGMATLKVFYYDRPAEVYWDGGIVDWKSGEVPHDSRDLPVEGGIVKSEFRRPRLIGACRAAGPDEAVVLRARACHKVHRSTGGTRNPAVRFYHFRNRYLFVTAHGPSHGRLRWKLRYAWALWAYRSASHERESRQVFLAVLASLQGRSGPYEATGIAHRLVVRLDALLMLTMKSAKPMKRILQWIARMARQLGRPTGGEKPRP